MDVCGRCERDGATIYLTSEIKAEPLCRECFNKMNSAELGVELEEQPISISMLDAQGVTRNFEIEKRILPNGIFLEAKEDIIYGYAIAVHGELACDQHSLFQKLLDKVKQRISEKHLKEEVFPESNQKYFTMTGDRIIGMIDYDEGNEDGPLLIIDGKSYGWNEFGKVLQGNEGFQFELKIFDLTDDVK